VGIRIVKGEQSPQSSQNTITKITKVHTEQVRGLSEPSGQKATKVALDKGIVNLDVSKTIIKYRKAISLKLLLNLSLGHMCVDMLCIFSMTYFMSKITSGSKILAYMTLYNFLAFATQMLFGTVTDKINKNAEMIYLGYFLTLIGSMAVVTLSPYGIVLLGLGNSLYHVGAGTQVMQHTEKLSPLGVFVSTGAIGVGVGAHMGSHIAMSMSTVVIFIIAFAYVLLMLELVRTDMIEQYENRLLVNINFNGKIILACCFITVVIRGYLGVYTAYNLSAPESIAYPWLISAICLMLGKALGGIVSDKLSASMTAILSLVAAFILSIGYLRYLNISNIKAYNMIMTWVVMYNMTMPITLYYIKEQLPLARGTAFGLTTMALFMGYLIGVVSRITSIEPNTQIICIMTLLSIVLMLAVVLLYKGKSNKFNID
jgi:hypothetical protein